MPADARVKVLFLAGKGRSGGTLLASLLGQLPGFFNIGELNRLWDWGLVSNHRCGCGLPVRECPTWAALLARADELLAGTGIPPLPEAGIDRTQASVVRWPNMPRLLAAKPGRAARWPELDRYTTATSAVYRAIADVTGARVVVDSSRLPIEPVGLGLVPGVDVRVAQVVRDPRGVVYSWRRSRRMTDRDAEEYMPRFSALFTTTSWLARNLVVEILRRRHREVPVVHYDDLARDPASVLRGLAALVDEPAGDLAFLTSESAVLAPTHTVGGNPVRMTSGAVTITPDDEWRARMPRRDRIVATTVAVPLLRRYGLPVRSHDAARSGAPGRPSLTPNAWLRFDAIRRFLRTARPATVVEIGAGEGALGAWLAARYAYTGVEPDPQSRATAEARITAVGGRVVASLDHAGGPFDLVCAFEVLEHIDDDTAALEQWHALGAPDGWLMLSVPAHAARYGASDELVGHYRRYERDALETLLEKTGFDPVDTWSYGTGLGDALKVARDRVAARRLRRPGGEATLETRSASSGRFLQPRGAAAFVSAAAAAPGRLVQMPFRHTDAGTGYVVLARRRP